MKESEYVSPCQFMGVLRQPVIGVQNRVSEDAYHYPLTSSEKTSRWLNPEIPHKLKSDFKREPVKIGMIGTGVSSLVSALLLSEFSEKERVPMEINLFESLDDIGGKMNFTRSVVDEMSNYPCFYEAGPMRIPVQHGVSYGIMDYVNQLMNRKVLEVMPFYYLNENLKEPESVRKFKKMHDRCEDFIVETMNSDIKKLEESNFNDMERYFEVRAIDYYVNRAQGKLSEEDIIYLKDHGIHPFSDYMKETSLLRLLHNLTWKNSLLFRPFLCCPESPISQRI